MMNSEFMAAKEAILESEGKQTVLHAPTPSSSASSFTVLGIDNLPLSTKELAPPPVLSSTDHANLLMNRRQATGRHFPPGALRIGDQGHLRADPRETVPCRRVHPLQRARQLQAGCASSLPKSRLDRRRSVLLEAAAERAEPGQEEPQRLRRQVPFPPSSHHQQSCLRAHHPLQHGTLPRHRVPGLHASLHRPRALHPTSHFSRQLTYRPACRFALRRGGRVRARALRRRRHRGNGTRRRSQSAALDDTLLSATLRLRP